MPLGEWLDAFSSHIFADKAWAVDPFGMANRNARSLAAELPLWLAEGLAAHLQATILSNFTLEPETHVNRRERGRDPLARAREGIALRFRRGMHRAS